jgi:hypothetical protein
MLALIDGDVIAHRSCETRSIGIPPAGIESLVYITDPKEREEVSNERDVEFLNKAWGLFIKEMESILENTWAEDFLMAVKHPENFRKDMFPEYKIGRHKDPSKMNRFVPMIRRLAVEEGLAIYATGREADDLLRFWANQAVAASEDFVIASVDKDLRCIPGKHYNPRTQELTQVSALEATRLFYKQLLMGDQSDSIPGLPRVGPVKADKVLAGLESEEEMQAAVVFMYQDVMGDAWFDWLLSNGKMLHIQHYEHDWFQCSSWDVIQQLKAQDNMFFENMSTAHIPAVPPPPAVGLPPAAPEKPRLAPSLRPGAPPAPPPSPPPLQPKPPQEGTAPQKPANPTSGPAVKKGIPFAGSFNLKK